MGAASEKKLGIRAPLTTRRTRSQRTGAEGQAQNFTPRLGPGPTVRHVKEGRNAASKQNNQHAEPLLVKNAQANRELT